MGDLPIAVLTPQGHFYLLADHLTTPLVVAKNSGELVWDWRNHDPFGNTAPTASDDLPQYDHRFPGQLADSETGLFYNYFRDYDPQTGRYVQSDPIGLDGGINSYNYTEGNPLSKADPTGQNAVALVAVPVIVGAAIIIQSNRKLTPDQLAERDRDYNAYKDHESMGRPPKGPNCDDLKRQRDWWKTGRDMRIDFTNKWYRGLYDWGHLLRVMIAQTQVQKIEKRMKDMGCPCD